MAIKGRLEGSPRGISALVILYQSFVLCNHLGNWIKGIISYNLLNHLKIKTFSFLKIKIECSF